MLSRAAWKKLSTEQRPANPVERSRQARAAARRLKETPGVVDARVVSDEEIARLIDGAREAEATRIFIGSENKLFSLSGSSLIVAPYRDGEDRIVGAVGVIGPTRLNYSRIVPMVDYTAQLMARLSRGQR